MHGDVIVKDSTPRTIGERKQFKEDTPQERVSSELAPMQANSNSPRAQHMKPAQEEPDSPKSATFRQIIVEECEEGELDQSSVESAASFEMEEVTENLVESLNWFSKHTLWMLKQDNSSAENDVTSDTIRQILINNVNKRISNNATVIYRQATT